MAIQLGRRLDYYRWLHSLIELIGHLDWPSRFERWDLQFLSDQTSRRLVYRNIWNVERFDGGIRRNGWWSLLIRKIPIELFPRHHVRNPRFFNGGGDFTL